MSESLQDPAPDLAESADPERDALHTSIPALSSPPTLEDQVVGCFVTGEELAEYRQAQVALNQVQKLKAVGQLTGGIAHDFNNLLTVILGNLAMLEDGLRGNPELYESAHTAMNAARRGADLTRRLLAFSRQQTLEPCLLAPGQQMQEIGELLKRALGASIELETVADNTLWNIRVDPSQLTNAILNLAINARDAMSDGGQLRIEASNVTLDTRYTLRHPDVAPGDYVRLVVSDTGCGMTTDVLEQAFEPFFTTKALGVGTGLGLSMVYGFVKQSGGHARIRSQIGSGTAVELYLPRHVAKVKDPLPSSGAETMQDENRLHGRETVLVVEDDPDIRDFVTRSLTGFGYEVNEAADGRKALTLLALGKSVDLLLSDMTMPGGVNGRDLIIEARRQYPELKVLCMSGHSEHVLSEGLPADCAFLEKPFLKQDLIRLIRSLLDHTTKTGSNGE
ncbi:MAG: response regulator [Gammaproteobacteria bacterium]|nr:response regulator [Gammaproteobacteria bacterium]